VKGQRISPTKIQSKAAKKSVKQTVAIKNVVNKGQNIKEAFDIETSNLVKHALICGITGSGKTNTCFDLLEKLWQQHVPFLVIEPAKTEYRNLILSSKVFKGKGQIYTLGDESTSPFRLNPFEIMKGVKVSAHIEALKTIFSASFEMYTPMPQVLEKALNSIYTVRGWDLVQNKNLRLPPGIAPGDPDCPPGIHPTMKDLAESIASITESFGYSDRIAPDVQAALETRIGGLLFGAKGQVLSSKTSLDLKSMYSQPTILELKDIFSDDERTFFASILLLHLSEYRKVQGLHKELQHVLVIEDAHRLLKSGGMVGNESAQPHLKFVNFFSNIFSEMRSYGEGIIVSTQNPAQIIPEVLSNTNLKIVHRLVTRNDLDAISGSTFLKEHHKDGIVALKVGEALVYGEGMTEPQNFKMTDVSKKLNVPSTLQDSDKEVQKFMTGAIADHNKYNHLGCDLCSDLTVSAEANLVANDSSFRRTYNSYVLSTVKDLTQLVHFRAQIIHEVQRILGRREKSTHVASVTWCALCQATDRYFECKGQKNYWFYDQVKQQQLAWLNLLRPAFKVTSETEKLDTKILKEWRDDFVSLHERDQGPLIGCGPCTSKCLYRFEVLETLSDPKLLFDFNCSINRDDMPTADNAAWFCRLLSERLIGQPDVDLAYCLAVHLIGNQRLSNDAQLVLLHKIRASLEKLQNGEVLETETAGLY
jgi:hypothetical protein